MIKLNLGRAGMFDIKTPTASEIVALALVLLFLFSIAYIAR